jgi:hypothetical protein
MPVDDEHREVFSNPAEDERRVEEAGRTNGRE